MQTNNYNTTTLPSSNAVDLLANESVSFTEKLKLYVQLTKFRLSALVVFSGVFGYLMAVDTVNWTALLLLIIGSYLITGSANTINQILEKDLDKVMKRTQGRPLPTGTLSVADAMGFAVVTGGLGFMLLIAGTNPLAAFISLVSLFLYAFFYTPLKQVSPISVPVGAIPGALPPLIGWVAATNMLNEAAWALFAIQFVWQFAHFGAIAWVGHEDYTKAGMKMLPTGKKDFWSAVQLPFFTLLMLPVGILPYYLGISGMVSQGVLLLCGLYFVYRGVNFMRTRSNPDALQVMFASFIYLPVMQLALLFDKL